MSGGSYDYAYETVETFVKELRSNLPTDSEVTTRLRERFARLLSYVADAMHDIEWVDSGDKSPGAETDAIRAVFDLAAELRPTPPAAGEVRP